MQSTLEEMTSYYQIVKVINRYARGGDRLDVELFKSAFWEDGGYLRHYSDEPMHVIADSLLDGLMRGVFSATQHFTSNTSIDFVDDDAANVETYFMGFHLTSAALDRATIEGVIGVRRFEELGAATGVSYELVIGGRYLDRFERRNGEWRIKARRIVYEWTTIDSASGLRNDEGLIVGSHVGSWTRRDRSDPSYDYES